MLNKHYRGAGRGKHRLLGAWGFSHPGTESLPRTGPHPTPRRQASPPCMTGPHQHAQHCDRPAEGTFQQSPAPRARPQASPDSPCDVTGNLLGRPSVFTPDPSPSPPLPAEPGLLPNLLSTPQHRSFPLLFPPSLRLVLHIHPLASSRRSAQVSALIIHPKQSPRAQPRGPRPSRRRGEGMLGRGQRDRRMKSAAP